MCDSLIVKVEPAVGVCGGVYVGLLYIGGVMTTACTSACGMVLGTPVGLGQLSF